MPSLRGRPLPSTTTCSLLVNPPRERPTPWLPLSAIHAACWCTRTIDVLIIWTAAFGAAVSAANLLSAKAFSSSSSLRKRRGLTRVTTVTRWVPAEESGSGCRPRTYQQMRQHRQLATASAATQRLRQLLEFLRTWSKPLAGVLVTLPGHFLSLSSAYAASLRLHSRAPSRP
jgi:hypothetical protein